ncbi:MAG: DegT/DnrJ/EryC1/StrS family aminotransferase [Candidatus Omnitrophica bacterium]|nr:DegT/DnrJ/EryC1/StrS family aminotransferase [Candidatus Omnitrophota bacterium]
MKVEYRLTERLSDRTGFEHTILTGNGTTAIYLLLCALGLRKKKVAIPDNTCLNVLMAILFSGNEPYYLDICADTGCIDIEQLKSVSDPDIAAVIFPYMYGQNVDISEAVDICKKKTWILIEDYAQAFGIPTNDKERIDSSIAILSFGSGKIIEAGHGGAVQVNSSGLKKSIEKLISSPGLLNSKPSGLRLTLPQFYKFIYNNIELSQFYYFSKVFVELFEVYKKDMLLIYDNLYTKKIILELNRLEDNISHRVLLSNKFYKLFSAHSKIKCMKFKHGSVPWRFNIFIAKQSRNSLLKKMLFKRFLVSSWFPPLSYIYPSSKKKSPDEKSVFLGDTILNLWVDKCVKEDYCKKISDFIMSSIY